MRVTKTVKEFIEKKVTEKIYAKYEGEKTEAERRFNIVNNFRNELQLELEELAQERMKEFARENDFIKIENGDIIPYLKNIIGVKDRCYTNSIYHWNDRAKKEVSEKVTDIIVTLELGGSKEDLERMIAEI